LEYQRLLPVLQRNIHHNNLDFFSIHLKVLPYHIFRMVLAFLLAFVQFFYKHDNIQQVAYYIQHQVRFYHSFDN
jgi:hypothetical protein